MLVHQDGRGLTVAGDPDHPSSRGQLCSKGMNLHHTVADRSDRLLVPQMRSARHHPLQDVTWDEAMFRAAAVFRSIIARHGPDSVGLFVSGQLLTEEYYLANKLCKGFLGTNNIDTNSRLCMSSAVVGYKMSLGDDAPPFSYDDIEASDCLFVTGANPAWCHPILFRRVEAHRAAHPEVKLIVADPRRTQTAEMADLHLALRPGSDIHLHNALAALLVRGGYADLPFLEQHCEGWQDLRDLLAGLDLAAEAEACDLPLEQIELAARMIGESKTLLTLWAMGLNQSRGGVRKNTSLINLNLITGRIGRPGCAPFSLTGQPNAMGGREVGGLATMLAAHHDLANPEHRAKVAAHWQATAPIAAKPGLTALEMVEAMESGKLKAIWIMCTNPGYSFPDLERVEKAFAKTRFVMVSECSRQADTLRFADLVLPAAGWLEKEGTMTNSERRITYLPKLLEPPGQALSDAHILLRFARAMGWEKQFAYPDTEAVFNDCRELTRGTAVDICGVSYARLRQGSLQWPCPDAQHPGTPRLFADHQFLTSSRKAKLHCVAPEIDDEKTSAEHPFLLITGRLRDQWHSMNRTGKVARLRQHETEPVIDIHPDDAAALGILEGAPMRLSNRRGQCRAAARFDAGLRRGSVFMSIHWGRHSGGLDARANNLTPILFDPVSKEPDLKHSAVKVEALFPDAGRILVVGAGAAALEFCSQFRQQGGRGSIEVFSREPEAFYNRVLLPDYLHGEKSWNELLSTSADELDQLQVRLHPEAEILRIDPQEKSVFDAKGRQHRYDTLVLATGSRPAIPLKPMPNLKGIFGLRTRRDADAIRDYLRDGGRAVVSGGGLLGLELAGALVEMGVEVTLVQRSSQLMRGQLDAVGSGILAEEIRARGIQLIFNDEVESVHGDFALKEVKLKSGRHLIADALFFAAGISPNFELGRAAGLKCSRGILVDERMRSSDPAIFAIGEIAEHRGRLYGTTPSAQDQARVAAAALAGHPHAEYRGSLDFNVLKIKDLDLCAIGNPGLGDKDGAEEIVLLDRQLRFYKKAVVLRDRLVGAILIGDKTEFAEFKELIAQGLELGPRRASLFRGGQARPPPEGPIVCSCASVGKIDLEKLVRGGCRDFAALCSASGAGLGCGSCKPEVKRLLEACPQETTP
ncbi:MAG: hypothetical protein RL095_1133 [Verrucomicrobiota bacterium]